MKMRHAAHGVIGIVLVMATFAGGCSSGKSADLSSNPPSPTPTSQPAAAKAPAAPILTRVTDRKGNADGQVLIVEYHHIAVGKTTMHRSPDQFRNDLERFYKMGFRPVTASEYVENRMKLAPGASPMVFTFDDSNEDQFKMLANGEIDPTCGVGIWADFAKTHPDFPVHATFFVLPKTMFGQKEFVAKKVEQLHQWGSELANHTVTHPILRKLPDDKVKEEIGAAAMAIEKLGEKGPLTLAYPFGSSPKNGTIVPGFDYKGQQIVTKAAFLVGANPSPAPTSPKLNKFRIPRIQACAGDYGIDAWLDKVADGKVKVYVQP